MKRRNLLAAVAAVAMSATAAFAADDKPAIVFDIGGKFDKSFNESMYNGSEKFKAETGIAYGEFEIANEAQREQAIRNFADQGYSPIIAAGFAQAAAVEKVAKEYPDLKFAIVDMVVDLPNVQSIVFKEHEGSYLVGMLAGMASKSGKVGFVGGMDIPLIRKFGCGYAQGVKAAKADATIFQNMTGDTGAAWNDPVKGGEITKGQMAQGADVVYAAAGATGLGVLQSAKDLGKLSIGFAEHEGSYLVGMMAGMKSTTGTVGFIGGMDIPLIRKFGCGYAQGVMAAKADAKVILNMTGTDPSAWNNPTKGAEIAQAQKSQGADVIFAAAGGTGMGVLQAAKDQGILSIGVDSNQNYLFPGSVLTSMLKRVDVAVYDAMKAGADLETGVKGLNLASDGEGYAMDENNASLVTPEMIAAVDAAAAKIKSGELVVHDYMTDNTCPAAQF